MLINFIRQYKFAYSLYNFFHKKELIHNETSFKKWGIAKKYYSSISSEDFKLLTNQNPETNVELIKNTSLFKKISEEDKQSLLAFDNNGYAILKNFVAPNLVDTINDKIENGLANKSIYFENKNKIMFAIHKIDELKNLANDSDLVEILSALVNGDATLFQSINFLMGSEQPTHSDSIHMTTFPLGGLLGVWIALDDIDNDNGPLHYYKGSHKLPYYMNSDFDNIGTKWTLGNKNYAEYEKMMQQKIIEHQLIKQKFTCKKGDLLIWHANLFHGGEPHLNKNKTRKSVVFHYFKKGSICYHEITQRPALLKH